MCVLSWAWFSAGLNQALAQCRGSNELYLNTKLKLKGFNPSVLYVYAFVNQMQSRGKDYNSKISMFYSHLLTFATHTKGLLQVETPSLRPTFKDLKTFL